MNNGQIILIDDNYAELRICQEAMKMANPYNELKTFNNAVQALEYIKHHYRQIFAVICDIKMPQMTGIELLEEINADFELKMLAIPFIFFSNSSNEKDVERAYSLA